MIDLLKGRDSLLTTKISTQCRELFLAVLALRLKAALYFVIRRICVLHLLSIFT